MAELAAEYQEGNFQRIDLEISLELLTPIGPRIEKQDTFMRKALSAGLRLAITMRFLATGDSYKSPEYKIKVANNSIPVCRIVQEMCEAIIAELAPEVCRCPSTPAEWMSVSKEFYERWNFHNTIGALDGKHITIRCPANAGSVYYNYKGYHSVVLLALVDANRFLYVDVGSNGRVPQGLNYFGVLSYSDALKKRLEDETKLFTPGERLEVEIRGCSIWAVELILQEMRRIRGEDLKKGDVIVNSIIIDFYLWTYCKDHRDDMAHIPIHKIRSIYY